MAEIRFGTNVSLKQAANIILNTPEDKFNLVGEPGIGKSTLLQELAKALPNHGVAYIDVPNMDLGDIAMPVIDHETRTTRYYPNARFQMHTGKPVIIMLDEFSKGAQPVVNMLHPLLEKTNPRLGDIPSHPDSIVFMTGNKGSDNVGDNLKAHTKNRIVTLNVRKPSADEWVEWAVSNDVAPEVCAFVKQFPHSMASYQDAGQEGNPYIFQPKKVQEAYFSPRSAHTASNIIKKRSKMDTESLICALTGAVGEATARDMQAFIEYADQLPTWESIIASPQGATVPTSAGACAVLIFGAISRVTKESMEKFMEYLDRFESEWQACFGINLAKSPKQALAFSSKKFALWLEQNQDLL